MENNKQTAVDWLFDTLVDQGYFKKLPIEQYHKAKAMERQQMIGLLDWMNKIAIKEPMRLETDHDDIVEQYYNETYGNEERCK
jgi:hypothetical protein